MEYIELISASTGASTSDAFQVRGILPGGNTIVAKGLAGAEKIDVQISNDGGTTYADLYQDGGQIQLTVTNTADRIIGPGLYKVDKPITAGSVSIGMYIPG